MGASVDTLHIGGRRAGSTSLQPQDRDVGPDFYVRQGLERLHHSYAYLRSVSATSSLQVRIVARERVTNYWHLRSSFCVSVANLSVVVNIRCMALDRLCGSLVCGNCSKRRWTLSYSLSKKASRVCDSCAMSAMSITRTLPAEV